MRKLTPEVQTARDLSRDDSSTPLCCMSCHSLDGKFRGCGSGSVGSGWSSTSLRGRVCFGGSGGPSGPGVDGVGSFATVLARLRFEDALVVLTGVSLGGSGTIAATSSRARALADRRGSAIELAGPHATRWERAEGEARRLTTRTFPRPDTRRQAR